MYYVPLSAIRPNPWQPRQITDPNHIKALAEDIYSRRHTNGSTKGLLQIPIARLVDDVGTPYPARQVGGLMVDARNNTHLYTVWTTGVCVQLAFGHSRIEAFRRLHERYPHEHFNIVPVELVIWGDEDMATAAWSENASRKDLNPAEEAHAIRQMMTDFGWTQDKAAEVLKINRSTVANKLRLLKLPNEVQQKLRDGTLSERQAIALLPLYELPQSSRQGMVEDQKYYTSIHPENIVKEAHKLNSDDLRNRVKTAVEYATKPLKDALFPLDIPILGAAPALRPVACQACEHLHGSKTDKRCSDRACFDAKQAQWQLSLLEQASTATGLPIAQNPDWQCNTSFVAYRDTDREALSLALQEGCPNLSLRFYRNGAPVDEERFPGVGYNCHYPAGGKCECQFMLEERAKKTLAAQAREAKETLYQEVIHPAIVLFVRALEQGDLNVWRALARMSNVSESAAEQATSLNDIYGLIAHRYLTVGMYQDPTRYPKECRAYIEERLRGAGLVLGKPLSDVATDNP